MTNLESGEDGQGGHLALLSGFGDYGIEVG
jgi:hypothetical protein